MLHFPFKMWSHGLSFQTEDSEIDVDEDDEEDEDGEEEESRDLDNDSLEESVTKGPHNSLGGIGPPLLDESDNDFWNYSVLLFNICIILFLKIK